jgi:hypothetical protein
MIDTTAPGIRAHIDGRRAETEEKDGVRRPLRSNPARDALVAGIDVPDETRAAILAVREAKQAVPKFGTGARRPAIDAGINRRVTALAAIDLMAQPGDRGNIEAVDALCRGTAGVEA